MSLLTGLVARYKLNEASGNALDDIGGHTLTDVNTVGAASGMRDFESANSEYFTVGDHADFSFADEHMTLVAWPTLESKTAAMCIVSKWQTTGNQREYELLYFDVPDRYVFQVSATGSSIAASVNANAYGSPATATMVMLVAAHDPAANNVSIQVNNGTINTTALVGGLRDGTSDFRIGARSTAANYFDGLLRDVLVYRRRLTAFERTALYNGGTPLDYDSYELIGSFFLNAGTDDGTSGTGSGYNNNASGIRVGGYFGTANFWIRFSGTDIPQGATILTANVTGSVSTSTGSGAKFKWYGVKEASPTYPTSSADYDGRSLTTATVSETRSGTGAYTSNSLVSIIQELVNQASFSGTLMLFAKDDGSNATYGGFENNILLRSQEDLTDTATLDVEWELGGTIFRRSLTNRIGSRSAV